MLTISVSLLLVVLLKISASTENANSANTWILKTHPDPSIAKRIASEHNFKILGSINLTTSIGYYVAVLDHKRINKRSFNSINGSISSLIDHETRLKSHPEVELFQREKILVRTKRDFVPQFNSILHQRSNQRLLVSQRSQRIQNFFGQNLNEDPQWANMWYMNRNLYDSNLPDMNVTGAWALGYSGKGVSVTFLDDGLEYTHPDIKQNYDPKASYDMNSNDNDPLPRYDVTNENK